MKKRIGLFLLLCVLLFPQAALAAEPTIETALEELQTEAVDEAAAELESEVGFSALLGEILAGEFDLSFADWKEEILSHAFGEFRTQGKLLTQLVLVVLLSAVLKQLSDSFQGKAVGEMGFYICYMVLVVVLITSFHSIAAGVVARMAGICRVFAAMVPVFLALCASSGNVAGSVWMGTTVMGGSAALEVAISRVLIPTILLAVSLELADHIAERPMLGRFAALLRQGIAWGMKGAAMAFMLLLSLQRIGGGALNGLAAKTARIAVGAVPVVGNVMGGAVETAAAVAQTLKSGSLVAAAVLLLLLCLPLVVKLAVILFVFRLTAAAAEFICEERLVACIAAAGDYTGLLLGVVFLGEGMFLFSALLLLGGL